MDELKKLVLSLNKSERRFFRDHALSPKGKDKPQYYSLFESLEKGDDNFPVASNKHSVLRRYLREQLLQSLILKHRRQSAELELRYLLDQIETIQTRGLPKLLGRLIQEGHEKAKKAGLPHYTLLFLRARRKLIRNMRDSAHIQEILELNLQEKQLLNEVGEEIGMLGVYDLFYLKTQVNLSAWQGDPVPALEFPSAPPPTFNGGLAYHTTQALQATLAGEHSTALNHFKDNLEVWHQFPRQIGDHPYRYISALINYLSSCLKADNLSAFQASFSNLKSSPFLSPKHQEILHLKVLDLQMLFHLNKLSFEAVHPLTQALEEQLLSHAFDPVLELSTAYNLFLAHFVQHQFPQALQWVNHILDHPRGEARRDLRGAARIMELILHYELGNWELLHYRFRMVTRIVKSWGLPDWTTSLIKALKSLLDAPKVDDSLGVLIPLKNSLDQGSMLITGEREVLIWITGKVQRISMPDAIQKLDEE